jgi:hypothetical protein
MTGLGIGVNLIELNCEELLLLNPREARTETIAWQNAVRQIRLVPIWQWLLEKS